MRPHSYATLSFLDYPRAELRAHLVKTSSCPPEHIDEVVDIACHAAASARLTLLETIDRAGSWRISTTAIGIAVSLLQHDMEMLRAGLIDTAKTFGIPVAEGTVNAAD